jgi:exopolyphosphatase
MSFSVFLKTSVNEYFKCLSLPDNLTVIHYVLGNESADLDSVISSLMYAYLLYENHSKQELYLPLINIKRKELNTRKDLLYLLQLAKISTNHLLFLEEAPFSYLFSRRQLCLNLVDHHILRMDQQIFSAAVESIIDHHFPEPINYPLLSPASLLIEPVGSTATLIAEKLFAHPTINITPKIATLLLAPILVDTHNLKSIDKTTWRDIKIAEKLLQVAAGTLPSNFYDILQVEKNNISLLSPLQLLNKDFKSYLAGNFFYGISSLPQGVDWWQQERQSLLPLLNTYAQEKKLSLLILFMSPINPIGPKRRIIVYTPSPLILESFKFYVEKDVILKKLLMPSSSLRHQCLAYYEIESFIARKHLQPYFHFLKNLANLSW